MRDEREEAKQIRRVGHLCGFRVVCGDCMGECVCTELDGHELPHRCRDKSELTPDGICRGEWNGPDDVVVYPTGATTAAEAMRHAEQLIATGKVDC